MFDTIFNFRHFTNSCIRSGFVVLLNLTQSNVQFNPITSQAGAKDTDGQIIKMSVKQRVIFTDRREEIGRSVAGGHNHEDQILDPDSEVRSTIYYLTHPGPWEN